jgi:hypothetical protein
LFSSESPHPCGVRRSQEEGRGPENRSDGADRQPEKSLEPDWLWLKLQIKKGDIQAAATHAQAFKFDYSMLKFDERGLTLFGKPILGSDKLTLGFITDWINKKLGRDGAGAVKAQADLQQTNDKVSQLKGQLTSHVKTSFKNLADDVGKVTKELIISARARRTGTPPSVAASCSRPGA